MYRIYVYVEEADGTERPATTEERDAYFEGTVPPVHPLEDYESYELASRVLDLVNSTPASLEEMNSNKVDTSFGRVEPRH